MSNGRADQLWLVRNFNKYQDKWVALRDGELIAVADTLPELVAQVPNYAGLRLTKV